MAKARHYRESTTIERPPAYQEYAAMALSAEAVRLMSAAERGLLWSMRLYCWTNDSAPVEPEHLARALGLTVEEVKTSLTPAVRGFFEPADDDATRLICPALVRQMQRLLQRREAQAQAGRDTARARRQKRFQALADRCGKQGANHDGLEYSTTQQSKNQLGKEGPSKATPSKVNASTQGRGKTPAGGSLDSWRAEYDREEVEQRR